MSGTVSTPEKGRRRPDWVPRFLVLYAETGNVAESARGAGCSREAPYRRAKADAAFAEAWAGARETAVDHLEEVARKRAEAGSDTLLIFLLKALRPEKYRDRVTVDVSVRDEAERIAGELGVDVDAAIAEAERILADSR
jgi:hypothetical protein